MNKKELIKNLISDIQDIYSMTNRFEQSEQIHPLDIDLSLSKVRNLYELLLKLKGQDSYRVENQTEEISTTVEQKKQTKEQPKEVKPAKEPDTNQKSEEQRLEEIEKEESKKEPEFIIETGQEREETESDDETSTEPEGQSENKHETSPEIVADKFHSKKFVHDDIAKKNMKKDVSSKMQSKPIPDINSAIGLNDKFIFIRELFHNNKDQYHETIQILNNFDTFENAVEYLNENFDWDNEDPNFERLKELVRRKFAAK
ncbi:MAG: hypothetical protein KQH79_11670 [Bacteroidetes bacterium]|nr:hypothetical protein [Bacteroidota bacterium]